MLFSFSSIRSLTLSPDVAITSSDGGILAVIRNLPPGCRSRRETGGIHGRFGSWLFQGQSFLARIPQHTPLSYTDADVPLRLGGLDDRTHRLDEPDPHRRRPHP